MTTPTLPESNLQRQFREQHEAQERLAAERERNPQLAAMAKAMTLTKVEREELAKVEARLTEAEASAAAAYNAHARALRGLRDPKIRAPAEAAMPGLNADLEATRNAIQTAVRLRNATLAAINKARTERRRAAKVKHAAKPTPVKSRGDWWSSTDRISGRDAA